MESTLPERYWNHFLTFYMQSSILNTRTRSSFWTTWNSDSRITTSVIVSQKYVFCLFDGELCFWWYFPCLRLAFRHVYCTRSCLPLPDGIFIGLNRYQVFLNVSLRATVHIRYLSLAPSLVCFRRRKQVCRPINESFSTRRCVVSTLHGPQRPSLRLGVRDQSQICITVDAISQVF